MQQRTLRELPGVSTQRGAQTPRTGQDGGPSRASAAGPPPWSPGPSRGHGGCSPRPPSGAPLWAWLLLAALLVPGAWSFLSEEEEELLVELHNHYRGQVSPTASAMLPLKWDANLKLLAEGYAAKCVWNHNPELEDTGENLFAGNGPLDLREALEKWFLEYAHYDFNNNSCDEDKMCGHYTQMVWADTHRVGCAFHLCNNMEGLDWERVSFLVCNYYPAGNYEGERPYVEGDWCSRCPENLQKCENNLCVADVEEEDDEMEDEDDPDSALDTQYTTSEPTLAGGEGEQREADMGEEAAVAPPPATTDSSLQVHDAAAATTPAPIASVSFHPRPETPPPGTPPPAVHATAQGEGGEEDEVQAEEIEEVKKESRDHEEVGQEVKRTSNINVRIIANSASATSPPLLLACLTAVLTVRL